MSTATPTSEPHTQALARTAAFEFKAGFWRLVLRKRLDADSSDELRDTCLDALDRGAVNVFIDVTAVELISDDALSILESVREALLARGGRLWIAAVPEGGLTFTIVSATERGLDAAVGVSPALGRAIATRAGKGAAA